MKIINTKFNGLKIIKTKVHKDSRGHFVEVFRHSFFKKQKFVFTCSSKSKKNVLRGMHFQKKIEQGKYLSVLKGRILDVVVDIRKKSKTFGKHFKIIISDKDGKAIYIPPGFAHGFLGLDTENIITYHCTNYRSKVNEMGIKWNDKKLKIKWPKKKLIISKKDRNNLSFEEYLKIIKN
jgi:dTDP-4-dehydrorhamnose 3,5-epimerase